MAGTVRSQVSMSPSYFSMSWEQRHSQAFVLNNLFKDLNLVIAMGYKGKEDFFAVYHNKDNVPLGKILG